MSTLSVRDEILKETVKFYVVANGDTTHGAKLAGVPETTFRRRIAMAREKGFVSGRIKPDDSAIKRTKDLEELEFLRKENETLRAHIAKQQKVPKTPFIKPVKKTKLAGELVRVVIPDSHGSHVDPAAWAAMIEDVKYLQPKEIVHLGDYMDCGGFLSEKHVLGYVAQLDEVGFEDDLAAWGQQLDMLQNAASQAEMHLLEGNHLRRLEQWAIKASLGHKKNADTLMNLIDPAIRLNYDKRGIRYARDRDFHNNMPVRGAIRLGRCAFTHGIATGPNAARKHAEKFGMPVVYGHTHTPASYFGKTVANGVHAAWSPGCLTKFAPRYGHTNPDNWGHGYLVQFVSKSSEFLTIHVPIIKGQSLLPSKLKGA